MKIAIIIVRVLLGLMLLFSSLFYFFGPTPPMPTEGAIKTFNDGIIASGYLMTLIKVCELVCGLAFVSGRFVALANLVILPVTVNIFMVHLRMMPEGLAMGAAVLIANLFLIYAYRNHYKTVFAAKLIQS